MGRSVQKCSYQECQLPENNKRYWWQFAYIVFGIICLAAHENEFSFFPLFTFIAPILIDLLGSEVKYRIANILRRIFIVVNVAVIMACFGGWYGVIEDAGSIFRIVDDAMIFSGLEIPKTVFLGVIVTNVFVPIMYSQASPCKARAIAPEKLLTKTREGVQ